jgi:cytochrome b involved in lipid metabolism
MRKIAIAISIVLSVSLFSPVANASGAEAGKKCKKVGRTAIAGDQELVCKKQGKKRVWAPVANKQPAPSPSSNEQSSTKGYTKAEVAAKNTTSECWTIIGNKVYDLTNWVSRHPGGSSSIASLCGIDGTSRFRNQHGMMGRPSAELDRFYIGDLK